MDSAGQVVRVVGAGAFVPKRAVSNERIAKAIPGWTAERILEKTGIRERRFLWDFDAELGRAIPPPEDEWIYPSNNVDMCEVALRDALEMAGMRGSEIDALFVVTCTPDKLHFHHDAMALHGRLELRPEAFALSFDDGCGGTTYVLDMAAKMIAKGVIRSAAVVGSAFTSPLVNREVYTSTLERGEGRRPLDACLSMYVFGDGAGAVVIRADPEAAQDQGIVASFAGNAQGELVARAAGGQLKLQYQKRATHADMAFVIDGIAVARSYPIYMRHCLEEMTRRAPEQAAEVKRYYFHQANKRVLDHFIEKSKLVPEKVAFNVDRYGNTSAAGMLILLAEDLQAGTVKLGTGDTVLIAAVGAGVHYGAQLIRL